MSQNYIEAIMTRTDIKQTENKTKSDRFSVPCVKCNGATKHQVLASIDVDGEAYDQSEAWSVNWVDHYQVIQCGGCESISFRHTSWFSEDADPMSGESGETERLYPKRGLETLPTKPYYNVPSNLRRIYSELIDCFNNDSPTLCAAGLRAIVEGICAERGVLDGPVEQTLKDGSKKIVRKDDLRGRISGLQEKGLLAQTSSDTLHEHRYLGNDAVHQLARPSTDELRLAIEIVEHTLEQLYELPEKAEELKRAKALRQKKQSKAHP
jgi:hypothetical protein